MSSYLYNININDKKIILKYLIIKLILKLKEFFYSFVFLVILIYHLIHEKKIEVQFFQILTVLALMIALFIIVMHEKDLVVEFIFERNMKHVGSKFFLLTVLQRAVQQLILMVERIIQLYLISIRCFFDYCGPSKENEEYDSIIACSMEEDMKAK
jgi:hypothetical protein